MSGLVSQNKRVVEQKVPSKIFECVLVPATLVDQTKLMNSLLRKIQRCTRAYTSAAQHTVRTMGALRLSCGWSAPFARILVRNQGRREQRLDLHPRREQSLERTFNPDAGRQLEPAPRTPAKKNPRNLRGERRMQQNKLSDSR